MKLSALTLSYGYLCCHRTDQPAGDQHPALEFGGKLGPAVGMVDEAPEEQDGRTGVPSTLMDIIAPLLDRATSVQSNFPPLVVVDRPRSGAVRLSAAAVCFDGNLPLPS